MTNAPSSQNDTEPLFYKGRTRAQLVLLSLAVIVMIFLGGLTVKEMAGVPAYTNLTAAIGCLAVLFLPLPWALVATTLGLFLGLVGTPLFPPQHVGLEFLFSGAGGYHLAPLVMAAVAGAYFQKTDWTVEPSARRWLIGLVLGLFSAELCGTVWLWAFTRLPLGRVLVQGTLWQALSHLFQGLIAFSVFYFVRHERRKRRRWSEMIEHHQRLMREHDGYFDDLDAGRAKPPIIGSDDIDEERIARERERLRKREKDDLPPWVKLR